MSDEADIDQALLSAETDEEDESSNLAVARTRRGKVPLSELRQPRQKFSSQWVRDFPWLRADKVDESVGICTVCNKQLVCKKSHLERHQRSYKHQRLLGGYEFVGNTLDDDNLEPTKPEFLECGSASRFNIDEYEEDEHDNSIEIDPEYCAHIDPKSPISAKINRDLVNSRSPTCRKCSSFGNNSTSGRLDRCKLLRRIGRERHALNKYYTRSVDYSTPQQAAMPPLRDQFDLFFESVSASVKTFPPKLAAEAKGRISQIMAEFELRAICEREAQENAGAIGVTAPEIVVASTTNETGSTVPQIVYTFQPKYREC